MEAAGNFLLDIMPIMLPAIPVMMRQMAVMAEMPPFSSLTPVPMAAGLIETGLIERV